MADEVLIELKKYFDYLIENRLKFHISKYTEEELEYLIPYLFDKMIEYCDGRKHNYKNNKGVSISGWSFLGYLKVVMRKHLFDIFNDELIIKNVLKPLYREERLKQILNKTT